MPTAAGQLYLNLRGFDPSGAPMTPTEAVRLLLDASACRAAAGYRNAIDLHRANGDRFREAETLARLAETCEDAGDAVGAADARKRAAAIQTEIDGPSED